MLGMSLYISNAYHSHLTTKGESGSWMDKESDKIDDQAVIETMTDATGNVTKLKVKKKLSKREEKIRKKEISAKINAGEDIDSSEDEFANENGLYL
jgi:hypothetical protein